MGDKVIDHQDIFGSADEQSTDGHVCQYPRFISLSWIHGPMTMSVKRMYLHDQLAKGRARDEFELSGRVLFLD